MHLLLNIRDVLTLIAGKTRNLKLYSRTNSRDRTVDVKTCSLENAIFDFLLARNISRHAIK